MSPVRPSEKERVLSELREMDPIEFEERVARLWEAKGWDTETTQASNDDAIDFYAKREEPEEETVLVQVKRRSESNPIGKPKVREYASLYQSHPDTDQVAIVTTGKLRQTAKIYALENDIEFKEGEELAAEMVKYRDEMQNQETGNRDSSSEPELGEVSLETPALPSPSVGAAWLFSPEEQDRWRNVVVLSEIVLLGGFIGFVLTSSVGSTSLAENLSMWAMGIGWLLSTYGVHKDMAIRSTRNVLVRLYAVGIVSVFPLFGPAVYLKFRSPSTFEN